MRQSHWIGDIDPNDPSSLGAEYKSAWVSMLVAGSCRSFPQDSRNSCQIYVVKRMIRGLGVETTLTYSQTLNM